MALPTTHLGSCHCRAVTWEIRAPAQLVVDECDCSICKMVGYLHINVEKPDFTLLTGQDCISTYTFNTGIAQHYFCTKCGIKSFYVPRSNPNIYSVNFRCLDRANVAGFEVRPAEGLSWEQVAARMGHLK
ncbi:hypothetical protein IWW55_005952 [Coemansia sp. RSA 2706]|nr:hypothetical protein LPJ63_001531 [Coemansia sp. RSA 2711]KAJ1849007.1 hypothetical protein LPJ70_000716 [Coemansia sp. RSA 2708]KAJ2291440.1 hypothetical protein IWW55_005952 [Coemansia sp. RSA 2706]KAJ2307396.1 hypothetical protein IWW52_006060 [Coemansia sp. RSA 2704]KAJ2317519.1 hypothetical protein IWW51_005344 [Coemansia sp. RSA 2702]KAJ2359073.1 hypothetical protein H4S01_006180 [Coemansia sp. RSA 2610]KAJ2365141.1 hypothetical protein H4S02_010732 [Coemansia sp. RSA 2611]KAJ271334